MLDWCESDDYAELPLELLSAYVFLSLVRMLFGIRKELKLTYLDILTQGCYANVCVFL